MQTNYAANILFFNLLKRTLKKVKTSRVAK